MRLPFPTKRPIERTLHLLALAAFGLCLAIGGPAGASSTQVEPPSNLFYEGQEPFFYYVNIPSSSTPGDYGPSSTGGAITSYSISPPLPAGLELDPISGVISGTGTTPSPTSTYLITGSNAAGSTSCEVQVEVSGELVSFFDYYNPQNPICTVGVPMTNTPLTTNNFPNSITYSVQGTPLPAGLSLNPVTAVISGTPTTASPETQYIIFANTGGGYGQTAQIFITVAPLAAPTSLSYGANPARFVVGQPIGSDVPSTTGDAPTAFSVSPALPAGLAFNTATGVITGTATQEAALATYTVKASNSAGSVSCGLQIAIVGGPTSLTYATNPATFSVGKAATADKPSTTGDAPTGYSVNPALPTGLTLNTTTGIISGTPTKASAAALYTVSAINAWGSVGIELQITVLAPPTDLTYATNPATFAIGKAITADKPSSAGGAPTGYSVNPALPTGLTLNTTTGIITGTPTKAAALATYTVKASNSTGSTSVGLKITVTAAPTNLSYATNPATFPIGKAIAADKPSSAGGAPTGYSVSPALPTGLTLNATTGIVSGTPTKAAALATYKVTASNHFGNTSTGMQITVIAAPANLTYATNPATFAAGKAITADKPSSSGGAPTGYSVSPALPTGLTLNTTTGIISGTSTAATALATYTVTASNGVGSTSVGLQITVIAPPANLSYATNPATFSVGTAITADAPSSTGGAPTGYSVSPALPTGLTLNTTTGIISGTPGAAAALATYTVTASNGAGSASVGLQITVQGAGFFAVGGELTVARYLHTATLLGDGAVLVACGTNDTLLSSTESYDPATAVSTAGADALAARASQTATLLASGDTLIVGGISRSSTEGQPDDGVIYNHIAHSFRTTSGAPIAGRTAHTATLLNSGLVLIAGGYQDGVLASAELYDPTADSFSSTGSLIQARSGAIATLLQNGLVLIAGGDVSDGSSTNTAELYDPSTGQFTSTGNMGSSRAGHTATLLPNGQVLIAGGIADPYDSGKAVHPEIIAYVATAELYDPASGTFSYTQSLMTAYRIGHTATLLADGTVLLAGGGATPDSAGSSAEIYDPSTSLFTATGNMLDARYSHTATLLPNGNVLLTGGSNGTDALSSTELYTP